MTRLFCDDFVTSFTAVGNSFAAFCEDVKNEIEALGPTCVSQLTSGPIQRDIATFSMVCRAVNRNNFPVKVGLYINAIAAGPLLPFVCQSAVVPPCNVQVFPTIDMTAMPTGSTAFIVQYTFQQPNGTPVCDKVFVAAMARSDLATVDVINSHYVPTNTLRHADFVPLAFDPACAPPCP